MDQNGKDDLKTQFITREGTYRLITLSEYSRPNRVGYQSNQNNPQVRVSLLPAKQSVDIPKLSNIGTITKITSSTNSITTNSLASQNSKFNLQQPSSATSNVAGSSTVNGISDSAQLQPCYSDKICFNFGKELYVYTYRGVKKNVDLCKPIDKKLYKGTSPSCHDFNGTTAVNDCAPLLVGFTTGQIQLVQPGKRETGRLYNEERLIDKTKVTCLKWLPKSPNLFLASHSSGHLYLYNEELPCSPTAPNYQNFKTGDGFTILTCKSKSSRNPLYKWVFNTENCSINEFCFSPCGSMLAIVSQDGFLRVFLYDRMDLIGIARSYFGGFLCVCWSPDSKYIVVGGEDDLVTVWSVNERRVVARGQGHRSWVSVVAFDPYTSYSQCESTDFSDDENTINNEKCKVQISNANGTDITTGDIPVNIEKLARHSCRESLTTEKISTSYRLGSVGQDTQLCLWDITEDLLRQSYEKRHRRSSLELQTDMSHALNEIKITKISSDGDNNSNRINTFRSKCNVVNSSNTTTTTTATTTTTTTTITTTNTTTTTTTSTTTTSDNSESCTIHNATAISDNTKYSNNYSKVCSNNSKSTNVMDKCTSTVTKNESTLNNASSETCSNKGNNALSGFNTLTQRFSHFNFVVNDKKSSSSSSNQQHSHKKTFIFSKSSENNRNGNDSDVVSTYDPMKLIGSAACPRFDECPLLEPLVCKKIAHERLTALIFREDCFLTACQDGFIYTWARPGYSNIPHPTSTSPIGASSGTVV